MPRLHESDCPDPDESAGCHATCPEHLDLARKAIAVHDKRMDKRPFRAIHYNNGKLCSIVDRGPGDASGVIPAGNVSKEIAELIVFAVNNLAPLATGIAMQAVKIADLEREVEHLRTALVDVCDRYFEHYVAQARIRRIRAAANRTDKPFASLLAAGEKEQS